MQRLSGADATFLYGETRNARMEIATCLVVDAADLPRGEALLERARSFLEPRLHLAPPLRRRLVRVPLSLDHPVWIEDPDFDLDYHLRHAALPAPGSTDQLGDLVGRLLSQPLDHTRPLWELYVIEGVDGDRGAVFIKSHHAAVDGVAAFQLLSAVMDLEPGASPRRPRRRGNRNPSPRSSACSPRRARTSPASPCAGCAPSGASRRRRCAPGATTGRRPPHWGSPVRHPRASTARSGRTAASGSSTSRSPTSEP